MTKLSQARAAKAVLSKVVDVRDSRKRRKSRSRTPEKVQQKRSKATTSDRRTAKDRSVTPPAKEKGTKAGSHAAKSVRAQNADSSEADSDHERDTTPARHRAASVSPIRTRSRSRSKSTTPTKSVQFADDLAQEEVLDYNDDLELEQAMDTNGEDQSNNNASPPDEQPPAPGGILGVNVAPMPKTITMTEEQLEQLINRSL